MKKIGFIVIAVVLSLGLTGAAYAFWTQSFNVNATVTSGTLSASIIAAGSGPDGMGASIVVNPKSTTAVSSLTSGEVTCNISNIYPGYSGIATTTITNTGNLPIKVLVGSFSVTSDNSVPSNSLSAAIAPCLGSTYSIDNGTVTTLTSAPIGPIAAGKSVIITTTVTIPTSGGIWDSIIGQSTSYTVQGNYPVTIEQNNQ